MWYFDTNQRKLATSRAERDNTRTSIQDSASNELGDPLENIQEGTGSRNGLEKYDKTS